MRRKLKLGVVLPVLVGAVLAVGAVIALTPGTGVEAPPPGPAATEAHPPPPAAEPPVRRGPVLGDPPRRLDRYGELFLDGVKYLRTGRSHEAIIVFSEATMLDPHRPDGFVNLGFAHLDQQEYLSARQAFEKALELNRNQTNAYWGLALALEAVGDLEGAVGNMRTYAHLVPKDTPHARKAWAALWEWESELKRRRGELPASEAPPQAGGPPESAPPPPPSGPAAAGPGQD